MEDSYKLLEVSKGLLSVMEDKLKILEKRLSVVEGEVLNKFSPFDPKREFEKNIEYIKTEKDLIVNGLKEAIYKTKGNIEGQKELVNKMEKEIEDMENEKVKSPEKDVNE